MRISDWSADVCSSDLYALALDGVKEPCRVLASNAGHALLTGIAAPDRAASVARLLTSPKFFSGWGIATLAAGKRASIHSSYKTGWFWPHDNDRMALGFKPGQAPAELPSTMAHTDLRLLFEK